MMSKNQRGEEEMKATIEFHLPEDQESFDDAVNGWKWQTIVYDLDQHLRTKTKYAPDDVPQEVYDALLELREHLHQELRESGLQLK